MGFLPESLISGHSEAQRLVLVESRNRRQDGGGLCVLKGIVVIWGMCPFLADWHISVELDLLRLVSVVLWADIF